MPNNIEDRLVAIEDRNAKVTLDKVWETSLTRKLSIAMITYTVAAVYMRFFLNDIHWYAGALVPVIGYLLSTLSLPFIRKYWQIRG